MAFVAFGLWLEALRCSLQSAGYPLPKAKPWIFLQESGQTSGSGDKAAEAHHQRLRSASSHSQQPESPQPTQSGYTMVTSEAGASTSGAAALAALAAAQAQVAGSDLRQAAELWQRQRSALESAGDLPSLASGEGGQVQHICARGVMYGQCHGMRRCGSLAASQKSWVDMPCACQHIRVAVLWQQVHRQSLGLRATLL